MKIYKFSYLTLILTYLIKSDLIEYNCYFQGHTSYFIPYLKKMTRNPPNSILWPSFLDGKLFSAFMVIFLVLWLIWFSYWIIYKGEIFWWWLFFILWFFLRNLCLWSLLAKKRTKITRAVNPINTFIIYM